MHNEKVLNLIAAQIGEGAGDGGCKWGAAALIGQGLPESLRGGGRRVVLGDRVTCEPTLAKGRMEAVEAFSERLAGAVSAAMARGHQPLVVGGDHSCAIGTWSAVADSLRPRGALGLVWIDAHLDAHTPETSDTQAPHGMPLAALLGHGRERLTDLCGWRGKVAPEHAVLIGVRSFEAGEAALLERLGVRVIDMPEVRRRGFAACLAQARALATRGTAGWGISFDVDAIDPLDAPGTGTPVEAGIRLPEALAALEGCQGDPLLAAFELAEYNPLRDFGGATAQAVLRIVAAALAAPSPRAGACPGALQLAA